MKKYIRFSMRNRENNITLPFEQAERILNSPQQIVMVMDEDGKWSGITINKADIIMTTRDKDEERYRNYNSSQLPEPVFNPFETDRFKPEFLKGRKKNITKTPERELKQTEKELKKKDERTAR